MCKEYPKLFCPPKNQRAIDYINDWIDSANELLQYYGSDLIELQAWRESIERDGTLDKLSSLISDVDNLKLYTVDGTTINLSKLAAITELFEFDGENTVIKADIIPGSMAPEDFEYTEEGPIPVRVDGVWYTKGTEGGHLDCNNYYVVVNGHITDEPAPLDKLTTIALAWTAANPPAPEIADEDAEDEEEIVNPFEESGIDENTKIAVTVGEKQYVRGGILFSGDRAQYLSGIGTFEDLPELPEYGVSPVTYAELIAAMNNDKLVPGVWYRITDYSTVVLSEGASSVKLSFDIIALAITNNTLDENVFFIQNASDTYFIDSNLKAWRGKYCARNDVSRFDFLNAYKTLITLSDGVNYVRYKSYDVTVSGTKYYAWRPITGTVYELKAAVEPFIAVGASFPAGTIPYDDNKSTIYTKDEIPEMTLPSLNYGYGYYAYPYGYSGELNDAVVYDENQNPLPSLSVSAIYPVSKGAIYSLTDEFGNSAPYDFKSIIFTWDSDEVSGFTFSQFMSNNHHDATDASITNKVAVYRNSIGELYRDFEDSSNQEYQRLSLNKILHAGTCVENSYGVNTSNIYVLGECRNNRWSGNSGNNKFSSAVIGNYFYPEFDNNTFVIPVKGNLIMEGFVNNSFTLPATYVAGTTTVQSVSGIVPEFGFSFNTIGNNFKDNICTMPRFMGNVIGKDAVSNRFTGSVGRWSLSGRTYPSALFTEDKLNFVGANIKNNFNHNIVTGGICSTSIGNNYYNNTIKQLVNCNIADQVQECIFDVCEELIMQGNNIRITVNRAKTSTIEFGCSYLILSSLGTGLVNGCIHRGVCGAQYNEKTINVDVRRDSLNDVIDFVSNNHIEMSVR